MYTMHYIQHVQNRVSSYGYFKQFGCYDKRNFSESSISTEINSEMVPASSIRPPCSLYSLFLLNSELPSAA